MEINTTTITIIDIVAVIVAFTTAVSTVRHHDRTISCMLSTNIIAEFSLYHNYGPTHIYLDIVLVVEKKSRMIEIQERPRRMQH